jgi:hypothetical protein
VTAIADNELALKAGWDRNLPALELKAPVDLGFEVELTGFETSEIDFIIDQLDETTNEILEPEDQVIEPSEDVCGSSDVIGCFAATVDCRNLTKRSGTAQTVSSHFGPRRLVLLLDRSILEWRSSNSLALRRWNR